MKKIIVFPLALFAFMCISCKEESVKLTSDDPIEQIKQLAEGVEEYGSEWTDEQWEDAVDKLEKAVNNISSDDEDLKNDEDLRKATSMIIEAEKPYSLKFRIMKIFTKRAVESMESEDGESEEYESEEE